MTQTKADAGLLFCGLELEQCESVAWCRICISLGFDWECMRRI